MVFQEQVGVVPRNKDLVEWCYTFLKDFQAANVRGKNPQPCLKINVDAAVSSIKLGTGMRAVIHDHRGRCVAASSKFLTASFDPLIPEIAAIKEGLLLAGNLFFGV